MGGTRSTHDGNTKSYILVENIERNRLLW